MSDVWDEPQSPEERIAHGLRDIAAGLPEARGEVRSQLTRLADAVAASESGGAEAGYWASFELTAHFDLDALARWTTPKVDAVWARLGLLRNLLFFLPIVVTWLGISSAVSAYQADIGTHPDDSKVPFLLLWQQGFGGRLSFPSLGTVALIDAVIVLAVIALTALLESELVRTDSADYVADRRSDIRQALVDAGRLLARYRVDSPEPWLAELMTASKKLLQEMRTERNRVRELIRSNTEQALHLATAGGHMKDSTEKLSALTRDLDAFSKSLDRSSRTLFGKAEAAAANQVEAAARLRDTSASVASVLSRQEQESQRRQTVLDYVTQYQQQIAGIAGNLDAIVNGMGRTMTDLRAAVEAASRLIEQIEGVELVVDAGPEPQPRPGAKAWSNPAPTWRQAGVQQAAYPAPPMTPPAPTPPQPGPSTVVPPAGHAQLAGRAPGWFGTLRRWLGFGG